MNGTGITTDTSQNDTEGNKHYMRSIRARVRIQENLMYTYKYSDDSKACKVENDRLLVRLETF